MRGKLSDFFSQLYFDELLVSGLARHASFMKYTSGTSWCEGAFGAVHENYYVHYGFPGNLEALRRQLGYDSEKKEEWLNKHTLFAFFSPFLKPSLKGELIQFMIGSSQISWSKIWNVGSQFDNLRYCSECVKEDRSRYGEAYWHRLHQICLLCPHHLQPIENSSIKKWFRKSEGNFPVTAETAALTNNNQSSETLFSRHEYRAILERLNQDILWVLDHLLLDLNSDLIKARLITVLFENGLLTANGRLRTKKFTNALNNYFSESLLNELGLVFSKGHPYAWATTTLDDKGKKHPFQYLLLIQFFGHTLATFLNVDTNYAYFGSGPWKCKNPVCPEYDSCSIKEVEVRKTRRKVIGIFQCSCGYKYQQSWSHRYSGKTYKVVDYGPLWEANLRKLWLEGSPYGRLSRISATLNVTQLTIKRYAVKLGLPDSSYSSSARRLLPGEQYKKRPVSEEDISKGREEWLKALEKFPDCATETLLKLGYHSLYSFLLRYDYDWIKSHQPSVKCKGQISNPILREAHYKSNDIHIAESLACMAAHLKNPLLYPKRRLSVALLGDSLPTICRVLDENAIYSPLSHHVISALTESQEQFVIRKLVWLVCNYRLTAAPNKEERLAFGLAQFSSEAKYRHILEEIIDLALPTFSMNEVLPYFWHSEELDWSALDYDLAVQVANIKIKILNESGYPVKVTEASIGYELQALPFLLNSPHKLPETTEIIRKSIEGNVDYGLRLVSWGYSYFANRRRMPSENDFVRATRLNNLVNYSQLPEVAAAIQVAIARLSRSKSSASPLRKIQQLHKEVTFMERDTLLAQEVIVAADSIRNMEPPVKVTDTSVRCKLDHLFQKSWNRGVLIKHYLKKLPKTVDALELVNESPLEFRLRKCCHIAARYRAAMNNPALPSILKEYASNLAADGLVVDSQLAAIRRVSQLDRYLRETIILAVLELLDVIPVQRVTLKAILQLIGMDEFQELKLHSRKEIAPMTTEALELLTETEKRFRQRQLTQLVNESCHESGNPRTNAIIVKSYLSRTFD
jgi:hypothetical protein